MLTNKTLQEYAEKKESLYRKNLGSSIKPMFKEGKCNDENWNCGSVYGFRVFAFNDLQDERNPLTQFDKETDKETDKNSSSIMVTRHLHWMEDTWYSTVQVVKRTFNQYITYTVTSRVYKNRGRMESIQKDGQSITEEDFVQLLKDIELVDYPIWK